MATTAGAPAAPAADSVLYLDPTSSSLVNISCFDLLLIELVPLAERMARTFEASLDKPPAPPPPPSSSSLSNAQATSTSAATSTYNDTTATASAPGDETATNAPAVPAAGGTGGRETKSGTAPPSGSATASANGISGAGEGGSLLPLAADGLPETDIFKDGVYVRLERLGFRVGQGLSERFSRDRPRFTDQLDVIKFLCKDLWTVVFKKQIDNLKTNHRGVFVLTDTRFRPFARMSMANPAEAIVRAQPHLFFPCGIIRGVLSSLGIKATVQAETTELPSATFQIKTIPAK
ncbi:Trafficking protein particle complex subunit 6B [Exophiala dermatitidis]